GDGLAAARHLAAWGVEVRAVLVGDRAAGLREPAAAELERAQLCGVPVQDAGGGDAVLDRALDGARLVVDGVLGTGLRDAPRPRQASAIRSLARAGAPVLSIDVPSGIDSTTGAVHDPCVRATDTAMLGVAKHGCLLAPRAVVGRLWLVDIGIPPEAYRAVGVAIPMIAGGDWRRLR
ncbi:MAG TPA: NAD(P)H-hydrate epimerase, partial [Candidatus Dormibacteraeota bacterium]|nr:NAD(P)H-hydrate epimerase [Candidatus Dormibacteraeota bacterium]